VAKVFSIEQPIRFSHCDLAGIVYFAHFFDMFSAVVEDWFAGEIGLTYEQMYLHLKIGFPIVATRADFASACRIGERVSFDLTVSKLGRSSIEFDILGRVGAHQRLRGRHKVAMISLESYRAIPIPEDLRNKMQQYVAH
jgi:4-hydroxybenzoyl-CoA thioesterase